MFHENLLSLGGGDDVCAPSVFMGPNTELLLQGAVNNGGHVGHRITRFCNRLCSGLVSSCGCAP